MDSEPDLSCPKCGNTMELLSPEEDGSLLRVCPGCATLAWNAAGGAVETREPREVAGEEKRKLLENQTFVTAEQELARLRNRKP
jgi:hypothetical protein